jgi:hypothetical protein
MLDKINSCWTSFVVLSIAHSVRRVQVSTAYLNDTCIGARSQHLSGHIVSSLNNFPRHVETSPKETDQGTIVNLGQLWTADNAFGHAGSTGRVTQAVSIREIC